MHYIPQETYTEPRRRPRLRRAAFMTAGILTVGVAVAACGGGPSRPGAAALRRPPPTDLDRSHHRRQPSGCADTTQAPAATAGASGPLLPTTDPFYKWSGSLARDAPGTILRTRTIAFAGGGRTRQ